MGLITNMNLCPFGVRCVWRLGQSDRPPRLVRTERGVVCALTWIGLFVAMETCAVLGAGGGIGNAVVWELAGRGLRVRAVSRDGRARVPDGVEACAADLTRPEGAARACADAAVVYHCVQPRYTRWAEEFPALNATIVAAVTEAGAKLVVADNLYMYGPISGPISETSPQEPQSKKGRLRKQLAASLLAAAETMVCASRSAAPPTTSGRVVRIAWRACW